jgi:hypothetical protein
MSARQARGQLANLRAMAEQSEREEMHGGGYFHGAGATPSMGLSQFRGGRHCVGGAGTVLRPSGPRIEILPNHPTAIVPYDPMAAAVRTGTRLIPYGRPGTTIKPYSAAEAQARLAALKPKTPVTASKTIAERLAAMGVTGSRVAAALALGIPLSGLIGYFASGADGTGRGSSGAYYPPSTVTPPPPLPPPTVEPPFPGTGEIIVDNWPTDNPFVPPGGHPSYYKESQPWWSYLQTVAPKKGGRRRRGGMSKRPVDEMPHPYKPPPRRTPFVYPKPRDEMPHPAQPSPPPIPPNSNILGYRTAIGPNGEITYSPMIRPQPIPRDSYSPWLHMNPALIARAPLEPVVGSGRSDGRSARAAVVRKVMQEKGLKLIEASKYVKEHGLY